MTYEVIETSDADGDVVELYTFTRDAVVIARYTSADLDVVYDGEIYFSPFGGLKRGEIQITGETGRAGVRLTVARNHPIVQQLVLRPRSGIMGCTIQRYHRSEPLDVMPIYAGRIMSSRRDRKGARVIVVEPYSVALDRLGLHRTVGPGCNHQLYGPLCRLQMDDWEHQTTIAAINGYTLEVADVHAGWPYTGGIIAWTDPDGVTDYAYIEEAVGETFTLDLPIYLAAATDPVTIYPGCDWTMATCHGVFDNSPNYGGRDHIPNINPVTDSAF